MSARSPNGITWAMKPTSRVTIYGTANSRQFFELHIGHGRVWYAFERTADRKIIDAGQFNGPECGRHAREWCEHRLQKPRRTATAAREGTD